METKPKFSLELQAEKVILLRIPGRPDRSFHRYQESVYRIYIPYIREGITPN